MPLSKTRLRLFSLCLLMLLLFSQAVALASPITYFDEVSKDKYDTKTKYSSWPEVAVDMGKCFSNAILAVDENNYDLAYENINFAYFGFYEIQGFEATVLSYLSRKRVNEIESQFRNIKFALKGTREIAPEALKEQIRSLAIKVYKDAMVLAQKATKEDSDNVGVELFSHIPDPLPHLSASGDIVQEAKALAMKAKENGYSDLETAILSVLPGETIQPEPAVEPSVQPVQVEEVPQVHKWYDFLFTTDFNTAFWLLIREGLEAILVVVAIVAYLIKTNNKQFIKSIYYGCLFAVVSSVVLAFGIMHFIRNVFDQGMVRELIEGWTMFLAVIVLFYVSNWILSKSETIAWENYIDGMVQTSLDKKSKNTLMFAAFLAVFREGAELVLFYTASFSGGKSNPSDIALGILLAIVVLVVVWIIFRYTTVKLPLKPFFTFTSILLFLLCISFMGKGVIELTEAGVIQGYTVIPAMNGFSIEALNVFDRAETLIPQIMLLVASVSLYVGHALKSRRLKKEQQLSK